MLYKTLKTMRLDDISAYQTQGSPMNVTLQTPVSAILDVFLSTPPLLIEKHASIDDAMLRLQKTRSKYALVTDQHQHIIGLLTYADLCSRKVLMMCERKGLRRDDLNAEDLMIPREKLHGIPIRELESAQVGALLKTLQHLNQEFALIVNKQDQLCGVISARDLMHAMNISVMPQITAHSFNDIFNVIHHHEELT
ncbi:CBS domain-containing protein [Lacimicrobium sp. SS2-24]|uniref:CBS domain-containing protein n=1 Tax=Lacimicrobium sp. SS2-24 TaxID=2005569 RepID=UPI00143BCC85|nr:CBS domain-containing protein [Lacimicrobium sp. SS2-24]